MDRNINAMNNQLTPINIYLDLSKVFDNLDHTILVSKLKYYGVQCVSLDLLKKNYLLGRSQDVDLDHTKICDENQPKSVMRPLLFNIVINDIVKTSSVFDLIMYADDNTLISTLETFGNR